MTVDEDNDDEEENDVEVIGADVDADDGKEEDSSLTARRAN